MPTERESLSAKVQSSYQQLSKVATDLNVVSDELGKCVVDLDAALKKLNLGVATWLKIRERQNERSGDFTNEFLGYEKINGKWGISLSRVIGNYNYGEDEASSEDWLFNEGPRELRLAAIEKIPELLNRLSETATKMAADVREKLGDAQQVAEAIKLVASQPKGPRPAPEPTGGR
ncbi:MAG: hypothetical protein ACLQVG_10040 [Terriglobia bacterium]